MARELEPLTESDLDVLSGMMVVFFHSAELCCAVMEAHYAKQYHQSKEYQKLCKRFGKAYADSIVNNTVAKLLKGDKRNKIGELINAFNRVKFLMDSINMSAIECRKKDVSVEDIFDSLQNNTNTWCRIYALMSNIDNEEDWLKFESTLKVLGKRRDRVSERILDRFVCK